MDEEAGHVDTERRCLRGIRETLRRVVRITLGVVATVFALFVLLVYLLFFPRYVEYQHPESRAWRIGPRALTDPRLEPYRIDKNLYLLLDPDEEYKFYESYSIWLLSSGNGIDVDIDRMTVQTDNWTRTWEVGAEVHIDPISARSIGNTVRIPSPFGLIHDNKFSGPEIRVEVFYRTKTDAGSVEFILERRTGRMFAFGV